MASTLESKARTRAFARVIGPFLVITPGSVAVRAPEMGTILSAYFQNPALSLIMGGLLLFFGLLIIANHQIWSNLAAILVSLFGWFLALRGVALLVAPEVIARAAAGSVDAIAAVRVGFGLLVLIGLYLSYIGWIAKPDSPS